MDDRSQSRLGVPARAWPVARAGVVLGLGLGGFFDGIVFHQVLQWHHTLSDHPDPAVAYDLELNVLADGLFHLAAYLATILGIWLLYRARRSPRTATSGLTLLGGTVAGWGLFNLLEGLVNHQLLGIHHVRPDGPGGVFLWDAAFLGWGALFVLLGYVLIRVGARNAGSNG